MRPDRQGARPRRTRRGTVREGNDAGADAADLECRDLREWPPGCRWPMERDGDCGERNGSERAKGRERSGEEAAREHPSPGEKTPPGIGPVRNLNYETKFLGFAAGGRIARSTLVSNIHKAPKGGGRRPALWENRSSR